MEVKGITTWDSVLMPTLRFMNLGKLVKLSPMLSHHIQNAVTVEMK